MFLAYLEDYNKEKFLKVCAHAALSNGVLAKEEEEMMRLYCREMDIPVNIPKDIGNLDDVLQDLAESANEAEKNIILLETLGIVKSDGVYDEKEKEFMKKLVNGLGAREGVLSKLNSLIDIYTTVYKELYATITE